MKTTLKLSRINSIPLAALPLALVAVSLRAQEDYTINWFTIDGGGGVSTGGVYTVSGTVGQTDVGPTMNGGAFSVLGGFWVPSMVMRTLPQPKLVISRCGRDSVGISWSPPIPGFVLQSSSSLTPPNWTNSPTGTTNPATLPNTLSTFFYRVVKQ